MQASTHFASLQVRRLVASVVALSAFVGSAAAQTLSNQEGLQLSVNQPDSDPVLHVTVPGGPPADRSFNILFPEHLTLREHGQTEARHLYIYQPGKVGTSPHWQHAASTLEYTEDFGVVGLTARATLQGDGILFTYTFSNHSQTSFDMISAVTDPRFKTFFYDPRLERTWVHHATGFDLLAAETPNRLTLPLAQWLPARYHAQLTAPIPTQRVKHRGDGITYYYKPRPVDVPLIATTSTDGRWIAASFSRDPGNVWSNPELTCQHVDPQVSLPAGQTATYQVKLLLFQGSLDQALKKTLQQLPLLEQSPMR